MNGSQKTWLCLIDQPGAVRAERHRTAVGQRGPRVRRLCLQHVPVDDTILYALLTLYLDKVFPSRYGQRASPVFLCLPSFWCLRRVGADEAQALQRELMARSSRRYRSAS